MQEAMTPEEVEDEEYLAFKKENEADEGRNLTTGY
jgi:hypothetical protein